MSTKTQIGATMSAWFDDVIATGERIASDVKRLRLLKRQAGIATKAATAAAKVAGERTLADISRRLDRVERISRKRGRAT